MGAPWVVEDGRPICTKCHMVKSLKQWEEELQKEVIRLRCTKERGPRSMGKIHTQKLYLQLIIKTAKGGGECWCWVTFDRHRDTHL